MASDELDVYEGHFVHQVLGFLDICDFNRAENNLTLCSGARNSDGGLGPGHRTLNDVFLLGIRRDQRRVVAMKPLRLRS